MESNALPRPLDPTGAASFLHHISFSIALQTLQRLTAGAPSYDCKQRYAQQDPFTNHVSHCTAFKSEFTYALQKHMKYIALIFPEFGTSQDHLKALNQEIWRVAKKNAIIKNLAGTAWMVAAKRAQPKLWGTLKPE
ncbi:hypothetical protein AURDEDRAFT_185639 [Auricularia subglabra TFB-10046 SS5]|nr:hypothetical protein AURDEDRAFT_185639 [Auricularia subglabra TFB-10046 SS5]